MAKPFVKWAGGKQRLLSTLRPLFPPKWDVYREPFLGGGAVFFGAVGTPARLSDINAELVNAYRFVAHRVEAVIRSLRRIPLDEDTYYKVRAQPFTPDLRGAVRFLYLNRAGFNGLYRVNRKGAFNVPFSKRVGPHVCSSQIADQLRAASAHLRSVPVACEDFRIAMDRAEHGDFVYCDPPYAKDPDGTDSFTAYTRSGFNNKDQTALMAMARELTRRGAYVMVSNSDAEIVRNLYCSGFKITEFDGPRSIKPGMDKAAEVVVTNY